MSGYLGRTMVGLICISLLSSFLPKEGAGKNVLFCARILVVLLILSPVFTFRGIEPELFSVETEDVEMLSTDFRQDAFCETLEKRIKDALLKKGKSASVTVFAKTDEAGNIVGVSGVEVKPYTEEIRREIVKMLEIEETLIREGA